MPNKKVTSDGKGLHVDKTDNDKSIDTIKGNGNPSNHDILTVLLVINDKLNQLLGD